MMVGQEMMIIIKLLFPLIIRNNGPNDALTMINDNTSSRSCTLLILAQSWSRGHIRREQAKLSGVYFN